MKRNYILLIATLCLASCISKPKEDSTKTRSNNHPIDSCIISSKPKLFLSFWGGMTEKEFLCVANTLVRKKELIMDNKGLRFVLGNDSLNVEPFYTNNGKVLISITLDYPLSLYPPISNLGQPRILENFINPNSAVIFENGLIKSYGKPIIERVKMGDFGNIEILKWQHDGKSIKLHRRYKELRTTSGFSNKPYVTQMTLSYIDKSLDNLETKNRDSLMNFEKVRFEKQMKKL